MLKRVMAMIEAETSIPFNANVNENDQKRLKIANLCPKMFEPSQRQ